MPKLNNNERLNLDWYLNRNKNIIIQKKYLLNQIKIKKREISEITEDIEYLNVEDLFELAIAITNVDLRIVLGEGRDFDDNTDAKFTTVRDHGGSSPLSDANVSTKNKIGDLRVLVYEPKSEKFYFFIVPYDAHKSVQGELEIPFNLDGTPKRSSRKGMNKWWDCEVDTFEELCNDSIENGTSNKFF